MKDVEFEYMKIIKERYPNLKNAVIDLGESLTLLFMANKLDEAIKNSEGDETNKDYSENSIGNTVNNSNNNNDNINSYNYNISTNNNDSNNNNVNNNSNNNKNTNNSYNDKDNSNSNIVCTADNQYYTAVNDCKKEDYKVRHENNKKIIKKYVDLLNENEVSKLKKEISKYNTKKVLEDFKNFLVENKFVKKCFLMNNGCNYLASIDSIELCWTEPYKIKENISLDDFDISEIKYLFKFSYYHVKTVMHKLRLMYQNNMCDIKNDSINMKSSNTQLFDKITFYIEKENEHLEFIIKCGKGTVSKEYKDVNYYVTEDHIQHFDVNTKYVYPQFVIDSFNANKILDHTKYITGKEMPEHVYPFTMNEKLQINKNNLVLLSKTKRRKIDELLKEAEERKY